MSQNKVSKMAAIKNRYTVTIERELRDEVEDVVRKATGVSPEIGEFVRDAIEKKLEPYRKMAADQTGKKRLKESA